MKLHSFIEAKYAAQTTEFTQSRAFAALESGAAIRKDYDKFIANICRTHLKSPQILAFLYSAAPPAAAENVKHNMLEELGLDETGVSHPDLLFKLAAAAGFDKQAQRELERAAQEELRRMASDPILFGTLKEIGLNVLLETTAFEWMLSRSASRIAAFLARYRGLSRESLTWFHHHSEVDIRHAEEGLQAVVDYLEFYEFDATDVEVILDITFRENVFIKRYFADWSASVPACNERLESAQSARASETLALQSLS
jgi:hypothetical protein